MRVVIHRPTSARLTGRILIGFLAVSIFSFAFSSPEEREGSDQAQPVATQPTAPLPKWVEEAIRMGLEDRIGPYMLSRKLLGLGANEGSFTTPFLRVAIGASEAKKKLKVFGPTDVTQDMLAPVVIVTAYPLLGEQFSDPHRGVEHVVIKKKGSDDPADAIQPTTIEPYNAIASTAAGGNVTRQGLIAVFPLEALREGNEFFILYQKAVGTGNKFYFPITKKMLEETMR